MVSIKAYDGRIGVSHFEKMNTAQDQTPRQMIRRNISKFQFVFHFVLQHYPDKTLVVSEPRPPSRRPLDLRCAFAIRFSITGVAKDIQESGRPFILEIGTRDVLFSCISQGWSPPMKRTEIVYRREDKGQQRGLPTVELTLHISRPAGEVKGLVISLYIAFW